MSAGKIAAVLLAATLLSACTSTEDENATPEIQMQVADGYIQYYNGETWENLIAVEDLRGPQGEPGRDGKGGKDGVDGTDGKDGAAGVQGPAGAKGETGATGPAGQDGVNGLDGRDGADGSSADSCNHVYRRISQVVDTLESYDDGSSLLRRTYTMVCDKCGKQTIMYYDFNMTPFPTMTPPPTPSPDTMAVTDLTPTPEVVSTPTPVPTPEEALTEVPTSESMDANNY